MHIHRKSFVIVLLSCIVFCVENYFSDQACLTMNALISAGFHLFSNVSILLFIILSIFGKDKLSSIVLFIGLLIVVPINLYWTYELKKLKMEADEIVHLAYLIKSETNFFPDQMRCKKDKRIIYTKEDGENFTLFFYVTTPNTGHFYSNESGWGYMDN